MIYVFFSPRPQANNQIRMDLMLKLCTTPNPWHIEYDDDDEYFRLNTAKKFSWEMSNWDTNGQWAQAKQPCCQSSARTRIQIHIQHMFARTHTNEATGHRCFRLSETVSKRVAAHLFRQFRRRRRRVTIFCDCLFIQRNIAREYRHWRTRREMRN